MKKIFGLDNIMENKGYFIVRIIISIMIGISFFLDSILVFKDWNYRSYWTNVSSSDIYFNNPEFKNYILFLIVSIISFLIISICGYIVAKYKHKFFNNTENKKNNKIYIIIFLCIFIMWLPYLLTFFPGGIYGDVTESINQSLGLETLNNHQPILYTFILGFFYNISKLITNGYQLAYVAFGICQFIFMDIMVSYFIYWWYKKGINKYIIIVLTAFCGLFNLFPLYAITLWKETIFSLFVVLYCFKIADIIISKGEKLKETKFLFSYIIIILLISFLRNNGVYAIVAVNIFLFYIYKKNKKFLISTLAVIIITVIIQGPIYNMLNIQGKFCEKVGVLLQQIGYVIVNDGNINEEQDKYLNELFKEKYVKEYYSPWNVDNIKFYGVLDNKVLEEDKGKFIKTWLELGIQNPKLYIEEYLLHTTGFWNINRVYNGDLKDYVFPVTPEAETQIFNVHQTNIIYKLTGISLARVLDVSKEISTAIFIFLILISTTYIFKRKEYKLLLIYLPILFLYGTILIATPIAFGLRYAYFVVLFVPFSFLFSKLEIK